MDWLHLAASLLLSCFRYDSSSWRWRRTSTRCRQDSEVPRQQTFLPCSRSFPRPYLVDLNGSRTVPGFRRRWPLFPRRIGRCNLGWRMRLFRSHGTFLMPLPRQLFHCSPLRMTSAPLTYASLSSQYHSVQPPIDAELAANHHQVNCRRTLYLRSANYSAEATERWVVCRLEQRLLRQISVKLARTLTMDAVEPRGQHARWCWSFFDTANTGTSVANRLPLVAALSLAAAERWQLTGSTIHRSTTQWTRF